MKKIFKLFIKCLKKGNLNTKKISKEEEIKKSINLNEILSNTKLDIYKINIDNKKSNQDQKKNNNSTGIIN
jgi:hypothetical protein